MITLFSWLFSALLILVLLPVLVLFIQVLLACLISGRGSARTDRGHEWRCCACTQ